MLKNAQILVKMGNIDRLSLGGSVNMRLPYAKYDCQYIYLRNLKKHYTLMKPSLGSIRMNDVTRVPHITLPPPLLHNPPGLYT